MAGGPPLQVFSAANFASSTGPAAREVDQQLLKKRKRRMVLGQGRMRRRSHGVGTDAFSGNRPPRIKSNGAVGADTPQPVWTNSTSGTVIGGPGTP
jgi:hypothetical protein